MMHALNFSSNKNIQLGLVFLINDVKKQRINGDVTVHVDHKLVLPPQNFGRTSNIHSGVEHHLALAHVGDKAGGVVGQLEPVEPSREAEQLAGLGGLRAGVDVSRAEERAFVEDGHSGGGVVNGGDVGVGDVDGEHDVGVEDRDVELERGEVD